MTSSSLAWLAHDPAEQRQIDTIIALFEERSTVDELGTGGIRDSIADQLFPGTSTIQTRLRYFLFVPWLYQQIEERRRPPDRVPRETGDLQYRLSQALIAGGERLGVIGIDAGRAVKRTPDSTYWNGLKVWGIRWIDGTMRQYFDSLPTIYRLRSGHRTTDEGEATSDPRPTWHPDLPKPPEGWLEETTFDLSQPEAEFLKDRIQMSNRESLLAFLAAQPVRTDYGAPWEHAEYGIFPERMKRLLRHAHLFSDVRQGAVLLYNLLLARKKRMEERTEELSAAFTQWVDEIETPRVRAWDLVEFWSEVMGHGHTITPGTRDFVHRWTEHVAADKRGLDTPAVHSLIEQRERRLKGPHARLGNQQALEKWRGSSGLEPLTYRWEEGQRYLSELADGLSTA